MDNVNATELMALFGKMKDDPALQESFRQHMTRNMQSVDADIIAMQKAMNAQMARSFIGFAHEAGFQVTDAEMNELLSTVSAGLHGKMHAVFQQEFAAAIGRMMK